MLALTFGGVNAYLPGSDFLRNGLVNLVLDV